MRPVERPGAETGVKEFRGQSFNRRVDRTI